MTIEKAMESPEGIIQVRKLIEHENEHSRTGESVNPVTDKQRELWEQRFEIANLLEMSDKEILEKAKKHYRSYVREYTGRGLLGSERWEDLKPHKQYGYVDVVLPKYNEDINEAWKVVRIIVDDFGANFSIEPLGEQYIVKAVSPYSKEEVSLTTEGRNDEDIAKIICDVAIKLSYPRRIATKKSERMKEVISDHYEELITKLSGKYQSLKRKTIEAVLFYLSLTPKEQETFDKFHSIKPGGSMPIKGILVPFFGMTKDLRGVDYKPLTKEIEQEVQIYQT